MDERIIKLRRAYYDYLDDASKLAGLETFVYANEWIREIIGEDDYLQLIGIDFHARDVRLQLGEILLKHLGWAEHQKETLLADLKALLLGSARTPQILENLYDKYCDGYYFLNDLGLGYGLYCATPHLDGKSYDSWDDLDTEQQQRILRCFQPQLNSDVQRAVDWLESGKIVLLSKRDDLNRMVFEDHRNADERKSTVWKEIQRGADGSSAVYQRNINIESKSWWKRFFWMK